jgi:hypothetical protein
VKVNAYQMALARKRAAVLGIPVDEHLRNVAAEQRRLDRIRTLTTDRTVQWSVIAIHAAQHGRAFIRWGY